MARRLALILFVLAGLLPMLRPTAAPAAAPLAAPAALADGLAPPALPRSCIGGGTPLDYAQPVCCVSGYVYLNGVPLAGASVTISAGGRTVTTQTQSYPDSPLPYFTVSLGAEPLGVQPGDAVTISASAGGQAKSVTFTAQEGGQQVDVVLPQIALNATWTPGERPSPGFRDAAIAYDAARERLLLFGGLAQPGETWEWDGRSWTRRVPMNAPPARSGHAMAYDTIRQRVVLFGGTDAGGAALSDTWEWDGAGWAERTAGVPPAISGRPAMVYDSVRARVLLVGASADNLAVWAWGDAGWAQLAAGNAPSARTGFGLAYDARRGRVVLFGGLRAGLLQQDTWEYDGSAWARAYPLSPPSARRGQAMTYDALRQRVLLAGGVGAGGTPLEDSWAWDGSAWSELQIDLPPRASALLAYDSARDTTILAGGYSDAAAKTYPDETWELDAIDWNQRAPRVSPGARYDYQMAYQTDRKRVVLFSGRMVSSRPEDTWEWDGVTWTLRTPPMSAPYTAYGAMVYDESHHYALMFGGQQSAASPQAANTTWVWDGHTWSQIFPSASPSPRIDHQMVYDRIRQRIVLFGGKTASFAYLSDTWEWDGTTWKDAAPSSSPPGQNYKPLMSYDEVRQQTVFLESVNNQIPGKTLTWDGTNWTEQNPTQQVRCFLDCGVMVYDWIRQRLVVLQKTSDTTVWEWDGTNWMTLERTPRPAMQDVKSLLSLPDRQGIVLFGQNSSTADALNMAWLWDGAAWSEQPDDSYVPGQLSAAAMAYQADGLSLLFGGRAPDGRLSGRTFRWQGGRWLLLDPATSPPARQSHQIVRNGDGGRLLMFGGEDSAGGYLDDTWLWDGADWQLQAPASLPSARAGYSLTFDARRSVWVLFGGQDSASYLGDTWEYDGGAWRQISPTGAPPARSGATLTYDEGRGVAVLVGGQDTGGPMGDVWEYDGAAWVEAAPAPPLDARSGHGAAYDPSRGVVVVVGGLDAASAVRGDTWEWNGSFWRERVASTPLGARQRMALAYDAARGELVSFGGEDAAGTIFADTQLHQASGSLSTPVPVATISRVTPRDARQGVDTISFTGRGADPDATDQIVAYRWTHNGAVISDQPSFTLAAAALPLGEQTIRFAVQDNEGDWSPAAEQRVYIRNGNAGMRTGGQTWTLLIYAVADNNLDPYMGESATLSGMLYRLRSAGAQANVQVGVLYDGPGVNDTRRYILRPDGQWLSETLPEARMDEMETLRDFVRWGYATFPSDYYALSLVDHANGVVGFGQDNTSDSAGKAFLTPIELRTALQQATDDGAHTLDVLHVDGCSFGLLEDAAIAADLAQYMVVSPNTGWGVFAYDRYRQLAGQAADPRGYAHDLAQTYAVAVGAQELPYTVSALDMARFAELNRRVSDLGDRLVSYVSADPTIRVGQLRGLRAASQKYDSGGVYLEIDPEDSYVDLRDFAARVQASVSDADVQSAAGAVIAGVAPFVIYESHASGQFVGYDPFQGIDRAFTIGLDQASGLAIFYPPRSSTNPASAYMAYVQHRMFATTRDSGWARFLGQGLPPQLSGDSSPMPNDVLIPPLTQGDQRPTSTPTSTATSTPTATSTATATPAPTSTATSTPTATSTATATPTTAPMRITGTISVMGGELSSSDGRFRISFPADAVPEDVIVTYTELGAPTHALPAGQRALRSFTFTAQTRSGQAVTHFSQPYTLVLSYTDAMLADLDEARLSLAFGAGNTWVPVFPCPDCRQNRAANHLSVALDHFTEFVLIGDTRWQVFLPAIHQGG